MATAWRRAPGRIPLTTTDSRICLRFRQKLRKHIGDAAMREWRSRGESTMRWMRISSSGARVSRAAMVSFGG